MARRIGLEISTTAVRMAEVASDSTLPRLLAFAQVRLPAGAVIDGAIADPQAVRAAIERCVREGGFGHAIAGSRLRVHLAVAGLQAIMREVEIPPVPPDEIDSAVRLQAIDIIPFPEEMTLFSARPLGTTTDENGAPVMRVLLAAAHRGLVEPFVDCATSAGLRPVGVDLAASALVRALGGAAAASEPEAIVSIGADLTTVVVHELGDPLFVRTIAEGGNVVTQALATALDLPLADAERLKRHLGQDGSDVPPEALHAAREGTARLLSEIRSSIDYFAALPGRNEVRRVVVTGTGSQLAELVERLQLQLIAPVVRGSVFEFVDTSDVGADLQPLDAVDLAGPVAIGLAMPPQSGTIELDLLPPEARATQRRRRVESRIIAVAAVLVALFVGTSVLRAMTLHRAQQQVAALQSQVQRLQAQLPKYDKVRAEDAQIEADQALATPIVAYEVNWIGTLRALAKYTPPGMLVESFSGESVPPAAEGVADNGSLPPPTAILATLSVSIQARDLSDFKTWRDVMSDSGRFIISSWSGISASRTTTNWSAALELTGLVHTARLSEFEAPK